MVIEHGELMCGTLSKTTLGNRSGSLMHIVAMECDRDVVKSFYDSIQTVVNNFLLLEGHSIGIEDAIADQVTYRDIQDTIAQAKVNAMDGFICACCRVVSHNYELLTVQTYTCRFMQLKHYSI